MPQYTEEELFNTFNWYLAGNGFIYWLLKSIFDEIDGREKSMANIDIRILLAEKRIHHYELAKELGLADATLSRKLRYELPHTEKQKMIEAINKLANR